MFVINVLSANVRKDQNMNYGKALFDWPIVLQYDVKAKYRLISRKFFGHEGFFSQMFAKPTKSYSHLFPLVLLFLFPGHHAKITLYKFRIRSTVIISSV